MAGSDLGSGSRGSVPPLPSLDARMSRREDCGDQQEGHEVCALNFFKLLSMTEIEF